MGIPLDNKTEAYGLQTLNTILTDKTFVQFGFREQEMTGYRAQNLYLPVTALVTQLWGRMTIPRIAARLQNSK